MRPRKIDKNVRNWIGLLILLTIPNFLYIGEREFQRQEAVEIGNRKPDYAKLFGLLESPRNETTNSIPSFSTSTEKKPYFFLHVGPPKTATTTIQYAFQEHAQRLASFDKTYYLGFAVRRRLANGETSVKGSLVTDLKKDRTAKEDRPELSTLQYRLKHHYEFYTQEQQEQVHGKPTSTAHNRHHLVLSMEGLSRRFSDKDMANALPVLADLFSKWKVRIIVTYRHYFDWLPSLYYQEQLESFTAYDKRIQRLVQEQQQQQQQGLDDKDKNMNSLAATKSHNPKQHHLSSFSTFLQNHLHPPKDLNINFHALGQHLSLRAYRMYAQYFDDVQVFFFHPMRQPQNDISNTPTTTNQNLVMNFVCQMIVTAPNLCQFLRNKTTSSSILDNDGFTRSDQEPKVQDNQKRHKNTSTNQDVHRLLEAGLNANIIPAKGRPTKVLLNALEVVLKGSFANNLIKTEALSWKHPFMTCLSDSLQQQFLETSIAYEEEMLELLETKPPQTSLASSFSSYIQQYREVAKSQHIQLFQGQVQQGKFCELDPDKVLQNETWRQILSNL